MKKKPDIFDIVINIIITVLSILVIYWLIKLLLGGSPDLSQFNFALILIIASLFVKLNREVGEIKVGIKYSFEKIKEDMDLIKKKLKI